MICAEDPFRCRPGEINGSMKMTGEVRLDGKKYRKRGIQNTAKASKP
jgi:hypothetical protein